MASSSTSFSPESMISAPRRTPAIPNANGTLAVFLSTAYSFEDQKKTSKISLLDCASGKIREICEGADIHDVVWGFEDQILWLRKGDKGTTDLMLQYANELPRSIKVANFDGPVSNLKIASLDESTKAMVVTGQSTPVGDLFNPEKQEKPKSSVRVYTSLYARHWNEWVTENKNSIFYASLKRTPGTNEDIHTLTTSPLANALKGHQVSLESPVPTFGGLGDFDVGRHGIVFVAKDPKLSHAHYTKINPYYIPLRTFTEVQAPTPIEIKTGSLRGVSSTPVFSPDGKSIAFSRQADEKYESDKDRLVLVPDITDLTNVQEFYETTDGRGAWDLKLAGVIRWSNDGKELFVSAEEKGKKKLWKLPSSPAAATKLPVALTQDGTVQDVHVMADDKLLVTTSSFIDSSLFSIVDPSNKTTTHVVSSFTKDGSLFGLKPQQIQEIWYQGDGDYKVHGFIITPSNFDNKSKYPLVTVIHGGPQIAIVDSWSTRWNLALFAEQGYVVFVPNFTGSSGYGMAFQNAIKGDWGGRPYEDIRLGLAHLEAKHLYIDTSRAAAVGASYGGFMVNYIQGKPLGRKFKALITHDGIMDIPGAWATDELFFVHHDFCGTPWDNAEAYQRWSPLNNAGHWATPHMIIHGTEDFRCLIGDAMMAFNILQTKKIDSKLVIFPGEGHWVLDHENSLEWHTEVFSWLKKHIGPDK